MVNVLTFLRLKVISFSLSEQNFYKYKVATSNIKDGRYKPKLHVSVKWPIW